MKIQTFVSIYDVDKYGNMNNLLQREEAHSFVFVFNHLLYKNLTNRNGNAPKDTGGTTRSDTQGLNHADAGYGDATYGIVVGTGTDAVTINDYKLQTQIAHGTGAGQLLYGTHSVIPPVVYGDYSTWFMARIVTNQSGNPITITEIAWYISTGYKFMLDRTLVTPYEIQTGTSRAVQYEFRNTV